MTDTPDYTEEELRAYIEQRFLEEGVEISEVQELIDGCVEMLRIKE